MWRRIQKNQNAEDDERDGQHERELRICREEAEVEAGKAAERADRREDAERQRVGEDQQRHPHVEEREHEASSRRGRCTLEPGTARWVR